jgi:Arc/MetJ family transcription regulator
VHSIVDKNGRWKMRTTIDIDNELLKEVMEKSGAKSKKNAIVTAMKDYLRLKRREELKNLIGNYDKFNLDLKDLRKMRNER